MFASSAARPSSFDATPSIPDALASEPIENPTACKFALASGLGQVLEQELGDAAALVAVLHEEGHLGLVVADDVVAADGDHLLLQDQDEGDSVDVVDVGEPAHVALGEPDVL